MHVCHHSMPPRQASSKAVRSSCELDAWVTTLQAQAFAAAERFSAICEREVSCEYLGQRKGRAPTEKYLQHPSDWKVAAGKERRTVAVCFRWSLVGSADLKPVITEQENKATRLSALTLPESDVAVAPGAPCTVWCARALAALNQCACDFVACYGPELLLEFGLQVQCTYAT